MKVIRDEVEARETSEGSKVNPLKSSVSYNHRENPGHRSLPNDSTLVSNEFMYSVFIVVGHITQLFAAKSLQSRIGVSYC